MNKENDIGKLFRPQKRFVCQLTDFALAQSIRFAEFRVTIEN